jgi:hypothetical protein
MISRHQCTLIVHGIAYEFFELMRMTSAKFFQRRFDLFLFDVVVFFIL